MSSQPPRGHSAPSALLLQDVRDDVGGAQDAGMLGILVRTGKNKPRASVILAER